MKIGEIIKEKDYEIYLKLMQLSGDYKESKKRKMQR